MWSCLYWEISLCKSTMTSHLLLCNPHQQASSAIMEKDCCEVAARTTAYLMLSFIFYCWNADLCLVVGKLTRKYLNRTCRTLWHLTGCIVEHWERRLTPLRSHSQLSLEGHSDWRNFLKNGRKQIFLFSSRGVRKRIYRPVSLTLNPGKEQVQGRAR